MLYKLVKRIFRLYVRILEHCSGAYSVASVYRKYYGIKIGRNVRFTGKPRWGSEPYLIEIGDDVTITQNVGFITHDGGVAVFRNKYPGINVFSRIIIGNNVFIGSQVLLLPGVRIGNNVVIAAGSIVTKSFPDNVVIGGVPAKVLETLEDYEKKTLQNCISLAGINPKERKLFILNNLR